MPWRHPKGYFYKGLLGLWNMKWGLETDTGQNSSSKALQPGTIKSNNNTKQSKNPKPDTRLSWACWMGPLGKMDCDAIIADVSADSSLNLRDCSLQSWTESPKQSTKVYTMWQPISFSALTYHALLPVPFPRRVLALWHLLQLCNLP